MKFSLFKNLAILLFIYLLMGCASRKEIVQFKNDTVFLKNQINALRAENREIKQMISNLNQTLARQQEEFNRTRADLLVELSALKEQSNFIDNKIEDNIQQISRTLNRPTPVQTSPAASDTLDPLFAENPGLAEAELDPNQLYNSAYKDLIRGNYNLALEGFRQYLINFPESEMADNAQYWIGEAFYSQKNYNIAFEEFKIVYTKYPRSKKVPAALLKMGYSLIMQGKRLEARNYLELLIQKYPNSEEARLGKNRLEEIR